jgi:ketosteroid isomerase-like protein
MSQRGEQLAALSRSRAVAACTHGAVRATPQMPRSRGLSSEVDVARRHLAAYNRRDLGAMRALSHPDLELDWSASSSLGAGVYRGIDAVVRFYEDYFDTFDEIIIEPGRMTLAGEIVVIPNVARMRGRDGIEVCARSTLEFTVRRARVAAIRLCP